MISFILGLIPGLGIAGKLAGAAVEVLTPVVKALVEFVIWYLKKLWEGIVDASDNLGTILLILTVAFGGALAGSRYITTNCPVVQTKPVTKAPIESWRPW